MNDYIEAIYPAQSIEIDIDGITLTVHRARFRLHLILSRLQAAITTSLADSNARAAHTQIKEYLALAGIPPEIIDNAAGITLITLYLQIQHFNAFQFDGLPFLATPEADDRHGTPDIESLPYDYEGREWAGWVTTLANAFGWSRSAIFEMWPEEVACYMQEAHLIRYEDLEYQRRLSEVSYGYNKTTKKTTYTPLPKPAWMAGVQVQKTYKINPSMLPAGNVINFEAQSNGVESTQAETE